MTSGQTVLELEHTALALEELEAQLFEARPGLARGGRSRVVPRLGAREMTVAQVDVAGHRAGAHVQSTRLPLALEQLEDFGEAEHIEAALQRHACILPVTTHPRQSRPTSRGTAARRFALP